MTRAPRAITLIFLLTALPLAGCVTTTIGPIASEPLPDSVKFVQGSRGLTLHHPWIEGDSLAGWFMNPAGDSAVVRVENQIESSETHKLRTLLAVGAVTAAAVFLFEVLTAPDIECGTLGAEIFGCQ